MFKDWDNFFFLVGSAAAGLIGLLFVVVTLTAGFERSRALRGASLYMTPTALHFALVLTMSAIAVAPDLSNAAAAMVLGVVALAGLVNAARASIGIAGPSIDPQTPPHWSDFWAYGALPAAIYLLLGADDVALALGAGWAVEAMAALALSLLLVSIRNAWDLVTFIAPMGKAEPS
jgi:hypothetical protein